MGIGIEKIKCGIRTWLTGKRMVWLCILLLLSGGIPGSAGSVVCAAGPEAVQAEDAFADLPEEEEPGDYAMLTHPKGNPGNYLKLTAAVGEHMVEKGDSLWKIAQKIYGDGSRWQDISALNGLSDPGRIFPGQYLSLPDREYSLQKPQIQRGEGYYLEDAGAFRFQTPERWALGTCSLDARLSTFAGTDQRARVLWSLEDNQMGEDAWAEDWGEVCADLRQTAETVFAEDLAELSFEKYRVESGNEVYAFRCVFTDKNGERQIVSAAYRFGQKNLMEFIGLAPEDFSPDMGRLTL